MAMNIDFELPTVESTLRYRPRLTSRTIHPLFFLAKKHPPARIQYKQVTSRFFAVSSYKRDKVWYDRCNFSSGLVQCVLISYPASEERDWDDISLSLSGR